MINVAVIGVGYWGPNLVRNFNKISDLRIVAVSDIDEKRLDPIKRQYAATSVSTRAQDVLDNPSVDAVAIATPISTHYELAREALIKGKHVLVEKPMTETVQQSLDLIESPAIDPPLLHGELLSKLLLLVGKVSAISLVPRKKQNGSDTKNQIPIPRHNLEIACL